MPRIVWIHVASECRRSLPRRLATCTSTRWWSWVSALLQIARTISSRVQTRDRCVARYSRTSYSMRVSSTIVPSICTSRRAELMTSPAPQEMVVGSSAGWEGLGTRGHAGPQLTRRERLEDEVVRADLQADQLVHLVGACGHDHDVAVAGLPDAAAHLDAVHVRQREVERDQVRWIGCRHVHCCPSVARRGHAETRALQCLHQRRGNVRIVIDDQCM